ncbi:hypothetical protein D3C80_1369720 [compost metagenome]
MRVEIDGQLYVPAPPPAVEGDWLEVRFFDNTSLYREVSVREFFREMLQKLWDEQEGFSGKRPFGNSGWKYPVIYALIKAGAIPGTITFDEDGYVEDTQYDHHEAHKFVSGLITKVFAGE